MQTYRPLASHVLIENCSTSTPVQAQARELVSTVLAAKMA
jgi:hypothetical protein